MCTCIRAHTTTCLSSVIVYVKLVVGAGMSCVTSPPGLSPRPGTSSCAPDVCVFASVLLLHVCTHTYACTRLHVSIDCCGGIRARARATEFHCAHASVWPCGAHGGLHAHARGNHAFPCAALPSAQRPARARARAHQQHRLQKRVCLSHKCDAARVGARWAVVWRSLVRSLWAVRMQHARCGSMSTRVHARHTQTHTHIHGTDIHTHARARFAVVQRDHDHTRGLAVDAAVAVGRARRRRRDLRERGGGRACCVARHAVVFAEACTPHGRRGLEPLWPRAYTCSSRAWRVHAMDRAEPCRLPRRFITF